MTATFDPQAGQAAAPTTRGVDSEAYDGDDPQGTGAPEAAALPGQPKLSRSRWWREVGWRHAVGVVAVLWALFPILFIVSAALNPIGSVASTSLIPTDASLDKLRGPVQRPVAALHPLGRQHPGRLRRGDAGAGPGQRVGRLRLQPAALLGAPGRAAHAAAHPDVPPVPRGDGAVPAVHRAGRGGPRDRAEHDRRVHAGADRLRTGRRCGSSRASSTRCRGRWTEAATVDGASHSRIFFRILLPLVRPILAVTGLLAFVSVISEFILGSIFLRSADSKTLAVGLFGLIDADRSGNLGVFAAGALLTAIPVVLLFQYLQRYIVGGLTAGGREGMTADLRDPHHDGSAAYVDDGGGTAGPGDVVRLRLRVPPGPGGPGGGDVGAPAPPARRGAGVRAGPRDVVRPGRHRLTRSRCRCTTRPRVTGWLVAGPAGAYRWVCQDGVHDRDVSDAHDFRPVHGGPRARTGCWTASSTRSSPTALPARTRRRRGRTGPLPAGLEGRRRRPRRTRRRAPALRRGPRRAGRPARPRAGPSARRCCT